MTTGRNALATALVVLLGCGGENSGEVPLADAGPDDPDARELSCSEKRPLTIGHCVDSVTDKPCLDFESSGRQFIAIGEQSSISPIVGLQGSPMFVMAVLGDDIAPGENEFAPQVDLQVTTDAGEFVGGYNARPIVFEDPNSTNGIIAPQLYVVSFFADEQVGLEVKVSAEVEDQNGDEWCGEASFTIGELIDAPPP